MVSSNTYNILEDAKQRVPIVDEGLLKQMVSELGARFLSDIVSDQSIIYIQFEDLYAQTKSPVLPIDPMFRQTLHQFTSLPTQNVYLFDKLRNTIFIDTYVGFSLEDIEARVTVRGDRKTLDKYVSLKMYPSERKD